MHFEENACIYVGRKYLLLEGFDEDKLYFIHVPETVKAEQQKVASLHWRRCCETKCVLFAYFRGSMANTLKSIFCDLLQ